MMDFVHETKSSQISTMVGISIVVRRRDLDEREASLVAREFDVFGGLDVDKKSIDLYEL
jgi:hypothetical protein